MQQTDRNDKNENEVVKVPEGQRRPERPRRTPMYLKDYELNTRGVK